MDAQASVEKSEGSFKAIAKLAKNIKRVSAPVPRFFETPQQVSSFTCGSEYDLFATFKLLQHEPYFLKASQKKLALIIKSGFSIHTFNSEIQAYLNARFLYMFMQTGKSLKELVKQIAYYLIVSSNAFIIKVRDSNFQFAHSYFKDGKEMHPVVGLFLAHPTTMRPKYKSVKNGKNGTKLEIEKWIHSNYAGSYKEFDPEDVVHFTVNKEDGMLFGMPDVVPVIDDIRTLRKIEEDVQLLLYRDLFPIIHYQIDTPSIIDHRSGWTELDQARSDMQNIIQDGGIATDKRHEINFVGSDSKGIDAKPYLEYFRERVFSGLGISSADMGIGLDIAGNTANSMSKQLTDSVRFVQQELSRQFDEFILYELMIQSPFEITEVFSDDSIPSLRFNDPDIEWRIRKENHEADLFQKGLKDIDESRAAMGLNEFTDDQIQKTFQGLYGQVKVDQDTEAAEHMARVQASVAPKTVKSATGATKQVSSAKDPGGWNDDAPIGKSAADRDSIKAAKSNSNIVKSTRDSMLTDSMDNISVQDQFKMYLSSNPSKLDVMFATRMIYDDIKNSISDNMMSGANNAAADIGISAPESVSVQHKIFENIDKLSHDVTKMVLNDSSTVNRAAVRVSTADRTEKIRGYNYGYAMTCIENGYDKFIIYSEHDDVSDDSKEYLGKVIELNKANVLSSIPPFRPNSRLKIKVIKENNQS